MEDKLIKDLTGVVQSDRYSMFEIAGEFEKDTLHLLHFLAIAKEEMGEFKIAERMHKVVFYSTGPSDIHYMSGLRIIILEQKYGDTFSSKLFYDKLMQETQMFSKHHFSLACGWAYAAEAEMLIGGDNDNILKYLRYASYKGKGQDICGLLWIYCEFYKRLILVNDVTRASVVIDMVNMIVHGGKPREHTIKLLEGLGLYDDENSEES